MIELDYKKTINAISPYKRLGQNFLVNRNIAKSEANFGIGRSVLELGPGLGMLTRELCRVAKHVTAVERDKRLYEILSGSISSKKLELINADFFSVSGSKLRADIMISNIPYNLSSKTVGWLGQVQMPAVLCLQKEFAEHMVAGPPERSYSRLSVFCALQFKVTYIMDVPSNDFYPEPDVGSSLVYLKPKGLKITERSYELLSLLMMHKKKKLRNALIDSAKLLGIEKGDAQKISSAIANGEKRPFQLTPEELLESSNQIAKMLDD